MQLNWWDLVELYCSNDAQVESILELLHEEKSLGDQVY